jgi:hypothetical protein
MDNRGYPLTITANCGYGVNLLTATAMRVVVVSKMVTAMRLRLTNGYVNRTNMRKLVT